MRHHALLVAATLISMGALASVAGDAGAEGPLGRACWDVATSPGVDACGVWSSTYAPGSDVDASDVAVSPDGARVFVVGGPTGETHLVAMDSLDGRVLWSAVEPGRSARPTLEVAPDGARVFVASTVITAFDAASGEVLWTAPTSALTLRAAPDGSSVYAVEGDGTTALDAATGAVRWRTAGGSALDVAPDGSRVFVTGATTRALDSSTGGVLWEAERYGVALLVSPDGTRVFLSGWVMVALDAETGGLLWQGEVAEGRRLAVAPDGETVFVVNFHLRTTAYDAATGGTRWTRHYNGETGHDRGVDVAASADGARVIVTGWETVVDAYYVRQCIGPSWDPWICTPGPSPTGTSTSIDLLTIAYDATHGTEQWMVRVDDPTPEEDVRARALAVEPNGPHVYVTATHGGRFHTVAYDGECPPSRLVPDEAADAVTPC